MMRLWQGAFALVTVLALISGPPARADQGVIDGRVTVNPLEVGLVVSPPRARAGQVVVATASVTNDGERAVGDLEVSLRLAPLSVPPRPIGRPLERTLAAGSRATQRWTVCADAPGQYMLLASARGTDAEGRQISAESDAILVTITPGKGRCPAE